MNYLAHAYLSFGIPEIVVGNLISDFVKGKKKLEYPGSIRTGITLHRAIDAFTDAHPLTRQAKSYFRSAYGLYSGPLTDIAYDHFLANDPNVFPESATLAAFARQIYTQLAGWQAIFPDRFSLVFPYMRDQDWLYHYRFKEGIFKSFAGLSRRAAYMPGPAQACHLFETHFSGLEACYKEFFPVLKDFALRTLEHPE